MARELHELGIDMSQFSYNPRTYLEQEQTIIKPQLEALGYTNITFGDGERDSFGPLTRIVYTTGPDGYLQKFIYG